MTARDAAHQTILVMRERETVTDLVTEVSMMATPVVREILSVEATTVSSLELTITPRMTAARSQNLH